MDELRALAEREPRFHLSEVYGTLNDAPILTLHKNISSNALWLFSGSQGFVNAAYLALIKLGAQEPDMRFEEQYPTVDARGKEKTAHFTAAIEEQVAGKSGVFKTALDQLNQHVAILDANGRILYTNKGAELITGYRATEMRGQTPRLWGGVIGKTFYQRLWKLKLRGQSFHDEIINQKKDGSCYTSLAHFSPVMEDGRVAGFIATEEDITRIKELEKELKEKEYRFAFAVEGSELGVWDWNVAEKKMFFSKRLAQMIGFREVVMPRERKTLLRRIHPEDQKHAQKAMENYLTGKTPVYQCDYRLTRRDGLIVWIRDRGKIIHRASNGSPVRISGTFTDITKEKNVDRVKTEFVSLAAHQLLSPLTAANWQMELLKKTSDGALNAKQRKIVDYAMEGARRMSDIIQSLLNVSRLDLGTFSVTPRPTDAAGILRETLQELQPEISKKRLRVRLSAANIPSDLLLDKNLLHIIFQNYLTNAIKYAVPQKTIRAVLRRVDKQIVFSVKDQGYGIAIKDKPKIFSKLFRTENAKNMDQHGTGLGLYVVKSIADATGGNVWFASEVNKGSEFFYSFPLTCMKARGGEKMLT